MLKKFLLLLFPTLFFINVQAQSQDLDLLKKIRNKASNYEAYMEVKKEVVLSNSTIQSYFNKCYQYDSLNNLDSVKYWSNKAIEHSAEISQPFLVLTIILIVQEFPYEAYNDHLLSILFKAREISNKNNWHFELAEIYQQISVLYYRVFMDEKAFKYADSALYYSKKSNNVITYARVHFSLGPMEINRDNFQKGFSNLKTAEKLFESNNANELSFYCNQYLGMAYAKNNQYDSAMIYLKKGYKDISPTDFCRVKNMQTWSFAKVNYQFNKYPEALMYAQKILDDSCMTFYKKHEASQIKYEVLEKMNKLDEALIAYKEYKVYDDSINKIKENSKILEIENKHEKEKALLDIELNKLQIESSKEIIKLEKEKKRRSLFILIILIFIVIVIFIAVLTVLKFRNSSLKATNKLLENKRTIQELELSRKQLALSKEKKEKELLKENQLRKQEELEYKKRELAASTLFLMTKNEFSYNVKNKLMKLKEEEDFTPIRLNSIIREIEQNVDMDKVWMQFKMHFETVHHNFFERLLSSFPDLTPNELKLCAYMRINLSTKEIAQLLNITSVAVNKRRNRLRKKIELDGKHDLIDFMIRF